MWIEYATFHYDINAHDFMQKLQWDIFPYLGHKIKIFKSKKHQTTLNKEAGIWFRKVRNWSSKITLPIKIKWISW